MAVSATKVVTGRGFTVATWVDDTGGTTGVPIELSATPIKTIQRVSGAGTYTVLGSNDGINFGPLATPIAAEATDSVIPIPENPQFLRVDIATAAATVVVTGV